MAPTSPNYDELLDWQCLTSWLGASDLPGSGPVTCVTRLTGGTQHHVFLVSRGEDRCVLRRPGSSAGSRGDRSISRESRLLRALRHTEVPHPAVLAVCEDPAVIGASFYVMEFVDGFTPVGALPELYTRDPRFRRGLAFGLLDGAASLALVDYRTVGLGSWGNADGWLERQVDRYRMQLEGYGSLDGYNPGSLPQVDTIGEWLDRHRPMSQRVGILHGDLQFANVLFSRTEPRLLAMIDWEMSSLGDPLLDLAWILTAWRDPDDPADEYPELRPASWQDMPSRIEAVRRYESRTGQDVSQIAWFYVLACYRLAIIIEGNEARARAGLGSAALGKRSHERSLSLCEQAIQEILTGSLQGLA